MRAILFGPTLDDPAFATGEAFDAELHTAGPTIDLIDEARHGFFYRPG